jgi:TPR repeat protein
VSSGVRGLAAARDATVRICSGAGSHRGQGLLIDLGAEGAVVLTCHHVIAPLAEDDLYVAVPQPDGRLEEPVKAAYDRLRSHPDSDAVVLRLGGVEPRRRPRLHDLDPGAYSGDLRATGITHLEPARFSARLSTSTPLEIPVSDQGAWPDPPTAYRIPFAFRLAEPSDAREGISGAVVVCEDGVVGLAHFGRAAAPRHEREDYLVPLRVWAEGWPELEELIEPLVDSALWNAATFARPGRLEVGTDVVIAGYREDIYLEPPALGRARSALTERGAVVIVGKPKSGKTRLALELIRGQPEALVAVPHLDFPPAEFEPAGLAGRELVLFFDDLQQTGPSSDPLMWRRRLEAATGRPCPIICTSRDGSDWKRVQEQPRLQALLALLGGQAVVFTSGEGAEFTQEQGERLADSLGLSAAEIERRFDGTPGSLVLDLADMRRRYEALREEARGDVSFARLLDSAKLLHVANQSRLLSTMLRAVAERVRAKQELSSELWETLERRTEEEGFGRFTEPEKEFRTYRPYLEECVAYEPSVADVEALLPILVEREDAYGLWNLAQALRAVYESAESARAFDEAERLLRSAAAGGDWFAAHLVGFLASERGEMAEAEKWWWVAAEQGQHLPSAFNLGMSFARRGDVAAAVDILRKVALYDDPTAALAASHLATLLEEQGDYDKAEWWYRHVAESGEFEAAVELGRFLDRRGDTAEAEQWYRQAAEAGHALAGQYLGVLLLQRGEEAEAERWFRRAADAGYSDSAFNLGQMLSARDEQEAERWFRQAANAGDPDAAFILGVQSVRRGDEAQAEQWYRQAAEAGDAKAANNLGLMLLERDEKVEAARWFRQAAGTGHVNAAMELSWLLLERGERLEGKRWMQLAADAGSAPAQGVIASMEGEADDPSR